jgi:hypothetical protein
VPAIPACEVVEGGEDHTVMEVIVRRKKKYMEVLST